jgi:hypothetical protein
MQYNAEYYKLNDLVCCNTFFESDDPGLSSDTGGVSCLRYIYELSMASFCQLLSRV